MDKKPAEEIYAVFVKKLEELERERQQIIKEFLEAVKDKKIKELQNSL